MDTLPRRRDCFLWDCTLCGASRHPLCALCGAPLHYRKANERPWDAHGNSHHACPPEQVPIEQIDWPVRPVVVKQLAGRPTNGKLPERVNV